MRKLVSALIIGFSCLVIWVGDAKAQRGVDWMTDNGAAQRSSWVRADAKISKESLEAPKGKAQFQLLWKLKLNNKPRQLNSLTPPTTLERLIGYRGFRMLGFVGGSSDDIFTIDTDLGRMEWEKKLVSTPPTGAGTLACPGGMTTGVTRPMIAELPPSTISVGLGRSAPAHGAVGQPGEGAVTLAAVRPNPPRAPARAPARPSGTASNSAPPQPSRPNPANPPGGQLGAGPFLVYALSSDGMLHSMHLSNGKDYEPPINFLPPGANASGLIIVGDFAYVITEGNCGAVANGLWALDLVSKKVISWKAKVVGLAGPAFDGAGTIYVATGGGGESPNSVVALDPKTLSVKSWYTAGESEFTSTPTIFEYKGKTLMAVTTKDGRAHLLDCANLGGADHHTALFTTPASKEGTLAPGALASWQDKSGSRWILAPVAGPLSSHLGDLGFTVAGGSSATNGAILAWKLVEREGSIKLQPAWASRDLVSPIPPTVINGVIFATSSGEFHSDDDKLTAKDRARRSSNAVIYALDGENGKELWNSGATVTSFTGAAALSGGLGQIYLTTYDGAFYAFGFPMEH